MRHFRPFSTIAVADKAHPRPIRDARALLYAAATLLMVSNLGCRQPAAGTTATAVELRRSDYKIKVPAGSTLDPPKGDIDSDHYTAVKLPNRHTLIILVIDDVATADSVFEDLKGNYKSKLQEATETASDMFNGRDGKGSVLEGRINGLHFYFEVGVFTGKKKAFLVVCTYEPADRAETRQILGQALDSFVIVQ